MARQLTPQESSPAAMSAFDASPFSNDRGSATFFSGDEGVILNSSIEAQRTLISVWTGTEEGRKASLIAEQYSRGERIPKVRELR